MSDVFSATTEGNKKTFISHVFVTTEEGKAELLNVVQYSSIGILPIIILNKLIQRFSPDVDDDKSSLEIVVEVLIQLIVMFCGIVFIHRIITYFPTYSGFKYEELVLTNVILAFLIIVLSIQTKLGLKVSIIVERIQSLWDGNSSQERNANAKKNVKVSQPLSGRASHNVSQGDSMDGFQNGAFPPMAQSTTQQKSGSGYDNLIGGGGGGGASVGGSYDFLQPANALLGSSFGAF